MNEVQLNGLKLSLHLWKDTYQKDYEESKTLLAFWEKEMKENDLDTQAYRDAVRGVREIQRNIIWQEDVLRRLDVIGRSIGDSHLRMETKGAAV